MDRLIIVRDPSTDQGTPGTAELVHPAGIEMWAGYSLELPWRDNASGISCVPPGLYMAHLRTSSKFGYDVYELENVPNRVACELHIGNWAGDVSLGFRSDVEGCTIFGTSHAQLAPPGKSPQLAVASSTTAFKAFMVAANGAPCIEVQYKWKDSQ
jgi:hypothetical protein